MLYRVKHLGSLLMDRMGSAPGNLNFSQYFGPRALKEKNGSFGRENSPRRARRKEQAMQRKRCFLQPRWGQLTASFILCLLTSRRLKITSFSFTNDLKLVKSDFAGVIVNKRQC